MMAVTVDRLIWDEPAVENCAFIIEDEDHDEAHEAHEAHERCGASCAIRSSYCPNHTALTHLAPGSKREAAQFREIAAIADILGGRLIRIRRLPTSAEIDRLTDQLSAHIRRPKH